MTVDYLRPTPLGQPVVLTGRVLDFDGRTSSVECVLSAAGKERARATVASVRVPEEWRHGVRT
jgi:hypothetical protein